MKPFDMGFVEGHNALERLKSARDHFERFAQMKERGDQSPRQRDLLNEARFRTSQITRLLEMIIEVMRKAAECYREYHEAGASAATSFQQAASLNDDLQILSESFYYLAHRTRTVIQAQPELRSFRADGITLVRNKLLEHPEAGDSGVLGLTFAWGGLHHGPTIKGLRQSDENNRWMDAGLFVNVDEFSCALTSILAPTVQ